MPPGKKYPCHHLELNDLPGKRWKDIREFEGYYQVSNLGRIKSLAREWEVYFPSRRSTSVISKQERILKQSILACNNHLFPDQPKLLCRIHLCTPGRVFVPMVSRLVYEAFKNTKLIRDRDIILHKNNIGLDNSLNNLVLAGHSEKSKLSFAQGRNVSLFASFSPAEREKITAIAARASAKKIAKYNLDGRRIKTYSSVRAAVEETGIAASTISNSAYGRLLTAGGFIWKIGDTPRTIDIHDHRRYIQYRMQRRCQPVGKYSKPGNKLLATYQSLLEAAAAHGHVNTRQISDVLNGRAKTAYGYVWKRVKVKNVHPPRP